MPERILNLRDNRVRIAREAPGPVREKAGREGFDNGFPELERNFEYQREFSISETIESELPEKRQGQ